MTINSNRRNFLKGAAAVMKAMWAISRATRVSSEMLPPRMTQSTLSVTRSTSRSPTPMSIWMSG